jgi:hypothetical protein
MAWRYGNLLCSITCIDDKLIRYREVHHEEFEGFFSSDNVVLPHFGGNNSADDIPVVHIDNRFNIIEFTIGDIIESVADRLDNPLTLECIDRLCHTSILSDDILGTWINEVTDSLDCDNFSHFFLQFFNDFV